jgi:hypothetical protein
VAFVAVPPRLIRGLAALRRHLKLRQIDCAGRSAKRGCNGDRDGGPCGAPNRLT